MLSYKLSVYSQTVLIIESGNMEVNKIKVKLGKDFYTGYYWIEPGKKNLTEIHVSYEGIQKSQPLEEEDTDKQNKIAEEIFSKLLGDL